ncbi:MAG TPA: hypothetical protein VHM65_04640 [Candidatus Lustribacter sp.]|nr:hypothetical protein [Candidatus Lustribacter sp.]
MHPIRTLAPLACFVLLAGCAASGSTGGDDGYGAPAAASSSSSTTALPTPVTAAAITELKTAATSLGQVVTDGAGMTLYMFTKDTQGASASACAGACLAAWPQVVAGSTVPTLTGVSGAVAMIATADGRRQVTLAGWPLYYFAKDKAPGDVLGQGVNQVWYVLDQAGTPVKK